MIMLNVVDKLASGSWFHISAKLHGTGLILKIWVL